MECETFSIYGKIQADNRSAASHNRATEAYMGMLEQQRVVPQTKSTVVDNSPFCYPLIAQISASECGKECRSACEPFVLSERYFTTAS